MIALKAQNIYAGYRKTPFSRRQNVLKDFSLFVEEGDFLTILGPNGSGKSTSFYVFLGLMKPFEGTVTLLGEKPDLGLPLYQRIVYLPEEPHYHLDLTVDEALRFYGSMYQEAPTKKQIDDILERLHLTEHRGKGMRNLSKGMKQKVGIGQCLFTKPAVVFMDEPTRGLDPIHVQDLRSLLSDLNKDGTTIIINSHVLSEVEMMTKSVAIMNEGKVVIHETLDRLLSDGVNRYRVSFRKKEGATTWPDYLKVTSTENQMVTGQVPIDRVYDFVEFTRAQGYELRHIIEDRKSLDEAFADVMEESS